MKTNDELYDEAFEFLQKVYEAKIFMEDLSIDVWFGNFVPPLFVGYLHFVMHFYNEFVEDYM